MVVWALRVGQRVEQDPGPSPTLALRGGGCPFGPMPSPPGREAAPRPIGRGRVLAGLRRRDDLAVPAVGECEPRTHLVSPGDHSGVACLLAELERGGPGGFRGTGLSRVLFEAADQEGEPAGRVERVTVLGQA